MEVLAMVSISSEERDWCSLKDNNAVLGGFLRHNIDTSITKL
jgi:hypothetical protein